MMQVAAARNIHERKEIGLVIEIVDEIVNEIVSENVKGIATVIGEM